MIVTIVLILVFFGLFMAICSNPIERIKDLYRKLPPGMLYAGIVISGAEIIGFYNEDVILSLFADIPRIVGILLSSMTLSFIACVASFLLMFSKHKNYAAMIKMYLISVVYFIIVCIECAIRNQSASVIYTWYAMQPLNIVISAIIFVNWLEIDICGLLSRRIATYWDVDIRSNFIRKVDNN